MTNSRSCRRTFFPALFAALLAGSTALAEPEADGVLDLCRQECIPACIEIAELLEERDLFSEQVQEYRQACGIAPKRSAKLIKSECILEASSHFSMTSAEKLCREPTSGTAACIREAIKHNSYPNTVSDLCEGATPSTAACIREASRRFSSLSTVSRMCSSGD
jgi:hypothetical protein